MTTLLAQQHRTQELRRFRDAFQVVPCGLSLPQRYTPRRIEAYERAGLFSRVEAVTLGEVRDGLLTGSERWRMLRDEAIGSWQPLSVEDMPTLALAVAHPPRTEATR